MYQPLTLSEALRQGFLLRNDQNTRALGNRDSYVGLSELARYHECPRAAIAAKLAKQSARLEDIITLQRGHWFECGVGEALDAVYDNKFSQLEISVRNGETPIRAHLDFTLVWEKPEPSVRILEIKSTGELPETPRESHRFQVQGQVSLLFRYWNEPVFSVGSGGSYTFPGLCKRHFGLLLPESSVEISLESWLVYISMRGCAVFGPYFREAIFNAQLMASAEMFWRQKSDCQNDPEALSRIAYIEGYHPLCAYCDHAANCPKFRDSAALPQWEPALEKLDSLKTQKAALEQDIRETEEALKQVYRQTGATDWLATGQHKFRVAEIRGRQSLDISLLHEELDCIFHGCGVEMNVDDLFKRCTKLGAPYNRLTVNAIK